MYQFHEAFIATPEKFALGEDFVCGTIDEAIRKAPAPGSQYGAALFFLHREEHDKARN